ncbi:MAG: HEAT repeat domain-containing protein [Candidatus Muiribacteriota bacterium]
MAEISEIIFKLDSTDPNIWRDAIESLKNVDKNQAKRLLMQIITTSPDLGKKYLAKKVLAEINPQEASKVSDEPEKPKPVLQNTEANASPEKSSGSKLSDYLHSDDYETVVKAIMHIMQNNLKDFLPQLVNMLKPEAHPFVRATLVKALCKLGGVNYLKIVVIYLKDEDNRVRANTIEALETLGHSAVFPYIMPMINDPDNRVKANALKAIKNLDREKMLSVIKNMMASKEDYYVISAMFVIESLELTELDRELEQLMDDDRDEVAQKARELGQKRGLKSSSASTTQENVDFKGIVDKVILNRGLVLKNEKGVRVGVIFPDNSKIALNQMIGVSGRLVKDDRYFFILPTKIGLIRQN